MKKIYLLGLLLPVIAAGCANTQTNSPKALLDNSAPTATAMPNQMSLDKANIDSVLKKVQSCVKDLNNGSIGKSVDGQILALTYTNPNAKSLFNSDAILSNDQVKTLEAFKRETQRCRQITNEFSNPKLKKLYQQGFAKLDRVYDDLMFKKVTIGVANQERALLIDDFSIQWRDAIKTQKMQ